MDVVNTNSSRPSKYVCYKLSRVMRKVHRYYERKLSLYGITPSQFYVLSAVWEKDGVKFKDLAKSLEMDGSTLTSILDLSLIHISEPTRLGMISYAVFCLKKKKQKKK